MICVDASLILKLLLDEEDSDKAQFLWQLWAEQSIEMIAPYHLAFEVISVLRHRQWRGDLTSEEAQLAFETFRSFDIRLIHPDEMLERAWALAQRFNRPTVYDSYYLAIGELLDCEVWTADRRLHLAVNGTLGWVKLLRDYQLPTKRHPAQSNE